MVAQIGFQQNAHQSNQDRQRHQTRRQHGQRQTVDQTGVQIFHDRHRTRRQTRRCDGRPDGSKECKRPIIAEENNQQPQDAQSVAHRLELGCRAVGAAAKRHRNLRHGEAFIDRLDG